MKWGQLNQRAAGAGLFVVGTGLQWWAVQLPSALTFGAGFLLMAAGLAGVGRIARQLDRALHPAAGWGLAVLVVALLNIYYSMLPAEGDAYLAGLFHAPVSGGRLGRLLLNSLLAFWLLSYAQRSLRWQAYRDRGGRTKAALAFLSYFFISLALMLILLLIRSLVLDSGLQFDFRNIFNLGPLSLTGMAGIVSLLLALLLLSLWSGRELVQLGLRRERRFQAIAASLLFSIPLMVIFPLDISVLTGSLILLLYLFLLDLFVELDGGSPAWLIIWLGLLAGVGAGFFFKYKLDKGSREHLEFARLLASPRDSLAEADLAALISADRQLPALATDSTAREEALALYLLGAYPYLGKNYHLTWEAAPGAPEGRQLSPGLWALSPNDSYYSYALGPYPSEGKQKEWLFFRPAVRPAERVFQELVPDNPARRSNYDFLVAFQEKPAIRRGAIPEEQPAPGWPAPGTWKEKVDSRYAALYYHAPEGYQITVGETLGGYLKPLSLFSYLFAILLLLALLLFGLSRYLNIFPATPPELLAGEPSLRHRIQLSVIVMALAAFAFIGLVTIAYFRGATIQYHQERLLETVNVLVRRIGQLDAPSDDALSLYRLADTHKVDLSLYRRDGSLAASSAPFLFANKWKEKRISQAALSEMEKRGFRPVVLDESVNGLAYKAAYVALPDEEGAPAFFLQIPYTAANQAMQDNVVEFMGALFNLYVFLLLMGGATAIALANSITRPLAAIGEKLRSFSLGRNEPLEWDSPDEIGSLVEAYNQMATKLEESAEKLRRSEREGAWREMAKQVAHEIKNPLTPMKLSIQYLQHARQADPERAAELIGRVSKTLIEQIDGLAHIATEFSNFAKMPQPQNEDLALNEVATSVYNLFTEHQEPEEDIELILPEQPIRAFADKGQLIRVLTNLVKNAQQAIPEGRKGYITVQLYQQNGASVIKVSDNGAGIPEEIQPKVFQPNFTTKSSGMGLGLAMCKGMVEAAGGKLYFKTEADVGTEFFVELPGVEEGSEGETE